MKRFELKSNWGYWDMLDGRELKPGDLVTVRWPDGTDTLERLEIEDRSYDGTDMGSPIRIPDKCAYFTVLVRGEPARVYVRDSKLQAVFARRPG